MKCQEIQELLSAYVDNTCTSVEKENIEKHISGCPSCKEELELLQSLVLSLNQLDDLELPSDFHQNLMDRIVILDQEKEITLELSTKNSQTTSTASQKFLRKFNHWRVYTSVAAIFIFVVIFAVIGADSLIQIGNQKTTETAVTYDMATSTMEMAETTETAATIETTEGTDTLKASAKMATPSESTENSETTATTATEDSAVMSMAPETTAAPETTSIAAPESATMDVAEPKALMSQLPEDTSNSTEKANPLATPLLTVGIIAFLLLVSRLIYLITKNRT